MIYGFWVQMKTVTRSDLHPKKSTDGTKFFGSTVRDISCGTKGLQK